MSDTKVFSFPDGGSYGGGSIPVGALPFLNGGYNNGGGFLGGNGWGGSILGFLIGLIFGNGVFGNGLFGGGFGGNNAGAGFLANQINNDNGRDLLMQAVTTQGEQSRAAVQTLSTMLGQDFNLVNSNVQAISTAINQIANAQGTNALQIVNAIQAGNASLASQFAQCCCQNQLAIAEQTAALQNGINGVNQSIAAKSAADQLATCQQTYTLTDGANRNTQAILGKLDAIEDSRKDREITALTAKVAQLESQGFTSGVVQSAVAPLMGQINALSQVVESIKRCQPSTITLPNNSMTAVPTIWANAVADNIVDRISAALPTTTTPATT